jgi:hypothetical protein
LYELISIGATQFKCNNSYMLTDIFAYRYADRPIWNEYRDTDSALLMQGYRMVSEQLFQPGKDGTLDMLTKRAWETIHSKLSMELGRESLSPLTWNYNNANKIHRYGSYSIDQVCKTWMLAEFKQGQNPDVFMKERISFIELAFRERSWALSMASINQQSQARSLTKRPNASSGDHLSTALDQTENFLSQIMRSTNVRLNEAFVLSCAELNLRFRRAKCLLNYHNGFIQIETDALLQKQVAEPFWKLVSDSKWINVETDMMEAVDRSESAQRDPAIYAVRALESAIKIISDNKNWSTGKEKGASQFIDNLRSTANGSFIVEWEAVALRHIFSQVRNGLSHGPGSEPMPALTQQQTDWTIEAAMSWTKSLIGRL